MELIFNLAQSFNWSEFTDYGSPVLTLNGPMLSVT